MLYFNRFRGKPAISEFDWPFTPNHKSSQNFATFTGSVLDKIFDLFIIRSISFGSNKNNFKHFHYAYFIN